MKNRYVLRVMFILCACAILFACGCSRSPLSRRLMEMQRIAETHPDSVRMVLDSIDGQGLSREEAARYGLLDALTRYKLFMEMPSGDSLLNIAEVYFATHGVDSLRMKALFLRSFMSAEAGKREDAGRDAIESWEIAVKLNDAQWEAKSAELVADQAMAIQNYQEELKWRKIAAAAFQRAGEEERSVYTLCDMAGTYLNLKDFENAKNLDDSISGLLGRWPSDTALADYYNYNSIFIHNAFGDIGKVDSLCRAIRFTAMETGSEAILTVINANILLNKGNFAECRRYLDSLPPQDYHTDERDMLYDVYYRLGKKTGDFQLVTRAADSLLALQSAMFSQALRQPVTATQRDFFQELAARHEAQKRARDRWIGWLTACGVIAAIVTVMLYRLHVRRKEQVIRKQVNELYEASEQIKVMSETHRTMEENLDRVSLELRHLAEQLEAATDELAEASGQLNDKTAQLTMATLRNVELERRVSEEVRRNEEVESVIREQRSELRKRAVELNRLASGLSSKRDILRELYTGQWEIINRLCREMEGDGKYDKVKWANIRKELETMKSEAFYRDTERRIDHYTDGMVGRLREKCKLLSEEEIRLAVFLMAGFSVGAIHFMLGVPESTIYSRRTSLIKKIEKVNPDEREEFLSAIRRK